MFARDTKNNMHTQQYISVRDLIENPLFLFLGVRLGFLGVRLGFCIFFSSTFYLLAQNPPHFHFHRRPKESRFGSTRRPQNAEANLSSKEESTRSHPYRPNAPGLGPRALLFFLLNRNISRWREREREGRNTHAAGVVWDLSRWRKKTPLLDGRVCERVLSNSLPSL